LLDVELPEDELPRWRPGIVCLEYGQLFHLGRVLRGLSEPGATAFFHRGLAAFEASSTAGPNDWVIQLHQLLWRARFSYATADFDRVFELLGQAVADAKYPEPVQARTQIKEATYDLIDLERAGDVDAARLQALRIAV
jgi:hypothetical protein